jgi:Ca2+-binding EF-hand superfamily protein
MTKVPALLMIFLATTFANAQSQLPPWSDAMIRADTDKDGTVDMDEVKEFSHNREYLGFQAFMADHFIALDQDNDGKVSNEEMKLGIMRLGMTDEEIASGFAHGFAFMSVQ